MYVHTYVRMYVWERHAVPVDKQPEEMTLRTVSVIVISFLKVEGIRALHMYVSYLNNDLI